MTVWRRWLAFNGVGLAGFCLQIMTMSALADVWRVDYRIATMVGVVAAVTHNFAWHWRWTWKDHARAGGMTATFLRFAGANGAISLAGNFVVMVALVGGFGMPAAPSNIVAVAVCGLVNYWVADRAVFARPASSTTAPASRHVRRLRRLRL